MPKFKMKRKFRRYFRLVALWTLFIRPFFNEKNKSMNYYYYCLAIYTHREKHWVRLVPISYLFSFEATKKKKEF